MKQTVMMLTVALLMGKATTALAQGAAYTQYTNLPTLYIETTSGADPADKTNYLPCKVTLVDGSKTTTYTLAKGGVRGRGNSTWGAKKKPWRLKFDSKVALIGKDFAKAKSWTVLANAFDKSLMRNALTYHLGRFMGLEFCPAAVAVDLVMNGTYRGTYQISDQMEVRSKRVPVDEDTGWLLEYANAADKVDDPKIALYWNSGFYGNVQIKNPEFAGDKLTANPALAEEIRSYLNTTIGGHMDTSVKGYDYVDPVKGYRALVDTLALVNWYVATEITANWDGFYSIYSYREGSGAPDTRLHLGPLWDEDLAYGNHHETYDYFAGNYFYTHLLADCNFDRNRFPAGFRKMQPVIRHLWDDPWFATAVSHRLQQLIDAGIQVYLEGKVDEMQALLAQSAAKNFALWSIRNDDKGSSSADNRVSWKQSVRLLRAFIGSRLAMMKSQVAAKNSANLYLDDTVDDDARIATRAASATDGVNVVMRRALEADVWTPVCLPFALTPQMAAYYFGEGAQMAVFSTVSTGGGRAQYHFATTQEVGAGVPCLVKATRAVATPYSFLSVALTGQPKGYTQGGWGFQGVFGPTTLEADGTRLLLERGSAVAVTTAPVAMQGYRAYFTRPAGTADYAVEVLVDSHPTGIADGPQVAPAADGPTYTADGKLLPTPAATTPHGLYIKKGVKVVR